MFGNFNPVPDKYQMFHDFYPDNNCLNNYFIFIKEYTHFVNTLMSATKAGEKIHIFA